MVCQSLYIMAQMSFFLVFYQTPSSQPKIKPKFLSGARSMSTTSNMSMDASSRNLDLLMLTGDSMEMDELEAENDDDMDLVE